MDMEIGANNKSEVKQEVLYTRGTKFIPEFSTFIITALGSTAY